MEPAIAVGTPVVVDTEWRSMSAGDVVCFRGATDDGWVLHRVLARFRLLGRTWVVQAPERADVAGVVGEARIVGVVRLADGELWRALETRERIVAARTVARWLLGKVWKRLRRG